MKGIWLKAILILILVVASVNCTSTNVPYYDYAYNHSASRDVTIDLQIYAIGNSPIQVLESPSDRIELLVHSHDQPNVTATGDNKSLNIRMELIPPTDLTNVGANITLYLPGNASYNITIKNMAAKHDSRYKDGSKTTVGEFNRPIQVIINNQTMVDKK